MKLLTITLHDEPTLLKDKQNNESEYWGFDITFQLDIKEFTALVDYGQLPLDFTVNSDGIAFLTCVSSVSDVMGECRSKKTEKISAHEVLANAFIDLQEQVSKTKEFQLLEVRKGCMRRVDQFVSNMQTLKEEVKELIADYTLYRSSIISAVDIRDQLTDSQIKGLFEELDAIHFGWVDNQMKLN